MNIKSWFGLADTTAPTAAEKEQAALDSRLEYVDALLALMVKKSLFTLQLSPLIPLPCIPNKKGQFDPPPALQAVINRLKILARLNPMVYAEPTLGKIEISRGPHVLVYTLRFDDKAAPPVCDIQLSIRNN